MSDRIVPECRVALLDRGMTTGPRNAPRIKENADANAGAWMLQRYLDDLR